MSALKRVTFRRESLGIQHLRTTVFVMTSIFSCGSIAGSGCQAPLDSDLPSCLYLTDSELNDAYSTLMSPILALLDEKEKIELKNEEREWIRHRNSECQLNRSDVRSSTDIKDPTKARCVVTSTQTRVSQLQERTRAKESEAAKEQASEARRYVPPEIPKSGKSVTDFVPSGYLIFEKVDGDFNGDKLMDLAMVLSPTALRRFDPRPLLILLSQPGGGYLLSARNDDIAMTYGVGGIANPNGTDILNASGRSLFVQSMGGGADSYSGTIGEFRLLDHGWFLVAHEESITNRQGNAVEGICDADTSIRVPKGWKCTEHRTKTDFRTGQVIESWTLQDKTTDQQQIKKIKRKTAREELIHFESVR